MIPKEISTIRPVSVAVGSAVPGIAITNVPGSSGAVRPDGVLLDVDTRLIARQRVLAVEKSALGLQVARFAREPAPEKVSAYKKHYLAAWSSQSDTNAWPEKSDKSDEIEGLLQAIDEMTGIEDPDHYLYVLSKCETEAAFADADSARRIFFRLWKRPPFRRDDASVWNPYVRTLRVILEHARSLPGFRGPGDEGMAKTLREFLMTALLEFSEPGSRVESEYLPVLSLFDAFLPELTEPDAIETVTFLIAMPPATGAAPSYHEFLNRWIARIDLGPLFESLTVKGMDSRAASSILSYIESNHASIPAANLSKVARNLTAFLALPDHRLRYCYREYVRSLWKDLPPDKKSLVEIEIAARLRDMPADLRGEARDFLKELHAKLPREYQLDTVFAMTRMATEADGTLEFSRFLQELLEDLFRDADDTAAAFVRLFTQLASDDEIATLRLLKFLRSHHACISDECRQRQILGLIGDKAGLSLPPTQSPGFDAALDDVFNAFQIRRLERVLRESRLMEENAVPGLERARAWARLAGEAADIYREVPLAFHKRFYSVFGEDLAREGNFAGRLYLWAHFALPAESNAFERGLYAPNFRSFVKAWIGDDAMFDSGVADAKGIALYHIAAAARDGDRIAAAERYEKALALVPADGAVLSAFVDFAQADPRPDWNRIFDALERLYALDPTDREKNRKLAEFIARHDGQEPFDPSRAGLRFMESIPERRKLLGEAYRTLAAACRKSDAAKSKRLYQTAWHLDAADTESLNALLDLTKSESDPTTVGLRQSLFLDLMGASPGNLETAERFADFIAKHHFVVGFDAAAASRSLENLAPEGRFMLARAYRRLGHDLSVSSPAQAGAAYLTSLGFDPGDRDTRRLAIELAAKSGGDASQRYLSLKGLTFDSPADRFLAELMADFVAARDGAAGFDAQTAADEVARTFQDGKILLSGAYARKALAMREKDNAAALKLYRQAWGFHPPDAVQAAEVHEFFTSKSARWILTSEKFEVLKVAASAEPCDASILRRLYGFFAECESDGAKDFDVESARRHLIGRSGGHTLLAQAYARLAVKQSGIEEEAIKAKDTYLKAMVTAPDDVIVLRSYADHLMKSGRPDSGAERFSILRRLCSVAPEDRANWAEALGAFVLQTGEARFDAATALEFFESLAPDGPLGNIRDAALIWAKFRGIRVVKDEAGALREFSEWESRQEGEPLSAFVRALLTEAGVFASPNDGHSDSEGKIKPPPVQPELIKAFSFGTKLEIMDKVTQFLAKSKTALSDQDLYFIAEHLPRGANLGWNYQSGHLPAFHKTLDEAGLVVEKPSHFEPMDSVLLSMALRKVKTVFEPGRLASCGEHIRYILAASNPYRWGYFASDSDAQKTALYRQAIGWFLARELSNLNTVPHADAPEYRRMVTIARTYAGILKRDPGFEPARRALERIASNNPFLPGMEEFRRLKA